VQIFFIRLLSSYFQNIQGLVICFGSLVHTSPGISIFRSTNQMKNKINRVEDETRYIKLVIYRYSIRARPTIFFAVIFWRLYKLFRLLLSSQLTLLISFFEWNHVRCFQLKSITRGATLCESIRVWNIYNETRSRCAGIRVFTSNFRNGLFK